MQDVQLAADGTRKLVSVLTSGEGAGKKVETVVIPMLRYLSAPEVHISVHKDLFLSDNTLPPHPLNDRDSLFECSRWFVPTKPFSTVIISQFFVAPRHRNAPE